MSSAQPLMKCISFSVLQEIQVEIHPGQFRISGCNSSCSPTPLMVLELEVLFDLMHIRIRFIHGYNIQSTEVMLVSVSIL